jgi:hypothetical protein
MCKVCYIDNHIIIRETVGYKFFVDNNIEIEDMFSVMDFLKCVYNYKMLQNILSNQK